MRIAHRAFTLLCLIPALARAQGIRGTVRDSIFRQPLAGAVLMLLDSAGATLGRGVSSASGEFSFGALSQARRVHVIRLGFRPRDVAVPAGGAPVDVVLAQLPRMLDTIIAMDQPGCPRRSDRATAFALWEQARQGLLASVVAREQHPADIRYYAYARTLARDGVTPLRQDVKRDSATGAEASFMARHTATDFVKAGFRRDSADEHTYLGPDADVMLDPNFVSGYCFSVAAPIATRPDEIGLRFAPAHRERLRVDIEGTVWVDTLARRIKDLEFKYVGVEEGADKLKPGGTVHFAEMPNGVVMIDRWMFRIVGGELDTVNKMSSTGAVPGSWGSSASGLRRSYYAIETGAELATSLWADSTTWKAELGVLRARAVNDSGKPLSGIVLSLDGTDYRATTDSAGRATIEELVPGPYTIVATDSTMAALGATLLTRSQFMAARDSTVTALVPANTAEGYVMKACAAGKALDPLSAMVVGRATTADGKGVKGARWEVRRDGALVSVRGVTGGDGFFYWCKGLATGEEAELRVWRPGEAPRIARARMNKKLTAIPVLMLAEGVKNAEFSGIVVSSQDEQPISAADVFLPALGKHAFTDVQGRFLIAEVPPGEHDITVRKVGFGVVNTRLTFVTGPTVTRRIVMERVSSLDTVSVRATVVDQALRDFTDNQRLGLGKFWDRDAMAKLENSRLSSILSSMSGSVVVRGNGNMAWIARSRGQLTLGGTDRSTVAPDDFDMRRGAKPACYADVFVDASRVYSGRNGEPLFDLNSISPAQIEFMEYYPNAASTPAKFSNLNTICGTLVIWTRR